MRKRNPRPRRPQPQPQRGRKPYFLIGLLAIAALVWFAPAIVVKSPLKDRIVSSATSDFQGTIRIGSISAGWLSSLVARDIVAFDTAGNRLAEVPSIRIEKNLVSLIGDRSDIGAIELERPVVNLLLRPDGSNLEDAIAEYLKPSESAGGVGCVISVVDGTVHVTDSATGQQWEVTRLGASATLPKDTSSPMKAMVDSDLTATQGEPGHLRAELLWQRAGLADSGLGRGNLSVQLKTLPIDVATPLAARFAPGLAASGTINGGLALDWSDSSQTLETNDLSVQRLALSAPQWIGEDQIKLDSIGTTGKLAYRNGAWEAEQLQITSDVGELKATGTAVVEAAGTETMTSKLLKALRYGRFQVDGDINLARVARMLPQTLRVRPGTQISTGQLTIGLVSDSTAGGQRWDGRVEASGLSAMHEGRRLSWDQPVVISLAAREANGGVEFEKLTCESTFLTVNAKGSTDAGSATWSGDLARLSSELGKFTDLGGAQLAGQLDGVVDWRKLPDQKVRVEGSGTAKQFQLVAEGRKPWREDSLRVAFSGVGQPGQGSLRAVDQATIRVQSGRDELALDVLPARVGTVRESTWPVEVQLRGGLASWLARAQPFFTLAGWNLDGAVDLQAKGEVSAERVQISQSDLKMQDLHASNGTFFIDERQVQIKTTGAWEQATSTFTSPDTTLASSTIAFRAADVTVHVGEASHMAGNISYRGDLGRLFALFADPTKPATQQFAGQATGQLVARHAKGVTSGEFSADIADFAYLTPGKGTADRSVSNILQGGRWSALWQEPRLKLGSSFSYDPAADSLQFSRMDAAGETLSFAAQGSVKELATRGFADVNGQIAYDLQQLAVRLEPQIGKGIKIAGRDTRPFSFQGPLFPPSSNALQPVSIGNSPIPSNSSAESLVEMMGQASLGWSAASIYGFEIGAGEVDARLAQGILSIKPINLAISDGRVTLAPQIYLDRSPMIVTLPQGPVAEQVLLSPEMCGTWLKYVAPLVADAAAVQGRFSLLLEQATIPFDKPAAGEIQGTLELHNAQVGPGPLSQQLLLLASIVKAAAEGQPWNGQNATSNTWLTLPQQRVAFRMAEQRVHHEGLEVSVKDVVIRTRGSVGTDQTLALVAEVPLRDEWLSRNKYLASMRGRVLQVPIQGTLSSPKLDQRALQQITQQTAVGAATGIIQDELNKQLGRGLEKLFGPPPR